MLIVLRLIWANPLSQILQQGLLLCQEENKIKMSEEKSGMFGVSLDVWEGFFEKILEVASLPLSQKERQEIAEKIPPSDYHIGDESCR